MRDRYAKFEELVGTTVVKVDGIKGDRDVTLHLEDGRRFLMTHDQDCCESVWLEDVCECLDDIVGKPILIAEETSNRELPPPSENSWDDSHTWTFYKIVTADASVTMRWYGESNGYYSESVDCYWMESEGHV